MNKTIIIAETSCYHVGIINHYADLFVDAVISADAMEAIPLNVDHLFTNLSSIDLDCGVACIVCGNIIVCTASKLLNLFKCNIVISDKINNLTPEDIYDSLSYGKMKDAFCKKLVGIRNTISSYLMSSATITDTLDYLLQTQCHNVTLKYVADYAGISASYLSYSFKQKTGISFKDYVHNYKMQQSVKKLLNSQLTITQIAFGLGYNDTVNFSRVFKKDFGITPSVYRSQNRLHSISSPVA